MGTETPTKTSQGIDYHLSHALYLFGHLKDVNEIGNRSTWGLVRALYTIGYLSNTLSSFPKDENTETRDKMAQAITKISGLDEIRDSVVGYRQEAEPASSTNEKAKEKFSLTKDELAFLEKLYANCMGNVDEHFNHWSEEVLQKKDEARRLYDEITEDGSRESGKVSEVKGKQSITVPFTQRDFDYWEETATTPGAFEERDIPDLLKMYLGIQKAKKENLKKN